jgi:hypothetical protein
MIAKEMVILACISEKTENLFLDFGFALDKGIYIVIRYPQQSGRSALQREEAHRFPPRPAPG